MVPPNGNAYGAISGGAAGGIAGGAESHPKGAIAAGHRDFDGNADHTDEAGKRKLNENPFVEPVHGQTVVDMKGERVWNEIDAFDCSFMLAEHV